jgi:hypothetical protein
MLAIAVLANRCGPGGNQVAELGPDQLLSLGRDSQDRVHTDLRVAGHQD